MEARRARSVVVGAGMAGLSATSHLLKAGFHDVTLLEASDRIGGRIHTVKFGKGEDCIVELGANWIHGGTIENSTFELAEKYDLLRPYKIFNRFTAKFMKEDGTEIDRSLVSKGLEIYWKIDEYLYEREKPGAADVDSVYQRMISAIESELDNIPQRNRGDISRVLQVMMNYVRFHNGDELENLSAPRLADYEDLPGGDLRIPYGYLRILQMITKDIPSTSIHYRCEVVDIKWRETGQYPIKLTCTNGKTFTADHVILTSSLGYLKKHKDKLFKPKLPIHKTKVIDTLGFGRVNKIFLQYKQPFVVSGFVGFAFAWDDTSHEVNFQTWQKRIFGIDAVQNNPNVLVAWVAGDGAEHMETLSDEEIGNVCTELLQKFLPGRTIPKPEKILVSRWCSNPYILGSYSYPSLNTLPGHVSVLAEPLSDNDNVPRVLFAGEATHERFFSTTHGARSSGDREANRLVELYSKFENLSKL